MKTNNLKSLIGAAALCATLAVPHLASAAVTPPVGYVKLTFNAESDTPFSLPMNRPMVYSGQASAISGNVISIANTDFTQNEFVYDETNQTEKYYVIFKTGALEGRKFDVTVNAAGSVTVNPDYTDDNTSDTVASLGAVASDTFEIRPHWTLATMFVDGEGVVPLTLANLVNPLGLLQVHDNEVIGINNNPSRTYVYFNDASHADNASFRGWYALNEYTTKVDDTVLRTNEAFVMRNESSDINEVNVVGDVPTTDGSNEIAILSDFIEQDNYKPSVFPIDVSLNEMFTSIDDVGFVKSTNATFPEGDTVLLYDDSPVGLNSNPTRLYVYFDTTGTANDGWYLVGSIAPGAELGDEKLIKAGSVYVVRKAEDSEREDTLQTAMPYDPLAE